jgi:hypothetical protein
VHRGHDGDVHVQTHPDQVELPAETVDSQVCDLDDDEEVGHPARRGSYDGIFRAHGERVISTEYIQLVSGFLLYLSTSKKDEHCELTY